MKTGLLIALLVGLASTATVSAQRGGAAKVDPKAQAAAMAEAPPVAVEARVACQVVDARIIGEANDPKTKAKAKYYEIDCDQGVGFILQKRADGVGTFTCIETNVPGPDGKPNSLACTLPGNANALADLKPLLAKGGAGACNPIQAKGIGQTPDKSYLEVACEGGVGYVLVTSAPADVNKPVEAQNCLLYDDANTNIKCTIGDAASRLAVVDHYNTESKTGCAIKDRRFMGNSQDNASFFEVSCQDGKGYIYKTSGAAVTQTYECAKAMNVLGGCTLTDARQAETEQAGLYTRLAKGAGFNCDVSKYAIFPASGNKDVVELVCNDGNGGVGVFEAGGKGAVYNCGHALVAGYRCGLNKPDKGYEALTADLRKFDQKSCVVSESRLAAKTTKGTIMVEVACADGLKGYMIEYSASPVNAVGATNCAFTGGCKLKGNV